MTWPRSSRAASQWSTPTPRTSPSSTRETGWSDDDHKAASAAEGKKTCSGAPPPPQTSPALHTSPSKESFLLWREAKHRCCPLLLCRAFFISSYLCLVVVRVLRGISTSSSSVSPASPREVLFFFFFAFILFCTTTRPLFLLDFS